ncbi:MAG: alpha/beta fold hydrolase [Salinibacterium sp.]|nr:alpha/beta hydrolase [Salinibacterium sp.]MBF0672531.1 alpha/beta fold hydrolase [Salinibacterium sp.]
MAALPAGVTAHDIETPSGKIHYIEAGEGHPVLLLHGSGPGATGWSNYAPNIEYLAKHFRVIAPDMPGWGESDTVTVDKRNHVQTALEILDALGIEKAAFVGNSMGGMTSTRFATTHPDRISHLITMGPGSGTPGMFGPAGLTEGLRILQATYRDPSIEGMRKLVGIMTFDPAFATEELIKQRSEIASSRPDHLKNFVDGLGNDRARHTLEPGKIAGIKVPALLIHGRDDRVVHFEHSLRLHSLIPNSRLLLINRCGHWAQLEHAAEFNRVVAGFIAEH